MTVLEYRDARGIVRADVQGRVVALSIEKGMCYGANISGSNIWRMLGRRQSVSSICTLIEAEFDVDHETCKRDVAAFLGELEAEGLIELVT